MDELVLLFPVITVIQKGIVKGMTLHIILPETMYQYTSEVLMVYPHTQQSAHCVVLKLQLSSRVTASDDGSHCCHLIQSDTAKI